MSGYAGIWTRFRLVARCAIIYLVVKMFRTGFALCLFFVMRFDFTHSVHFETWLVEKT